MERCDAAEPSDVAPEAAANVLVGFLVAVVTQLLVFPMFGLQATFGENLAIGAVFNGVSLARSYLLRRAFERISYEKRRSYRAALSITKHEATIEFDGLSPSWV